MFSKTIDKYKSTLEKSYAMTEKDKKSILFWVVSNEDKKEKVLAFENLFGDKEELAPKLMAYFREYESKGLSITQALYKLEADSDVLERIALGNMKSAQKAVYES